MNKYNNEIYGVGLGENVRGIVACVEGKKAKKIRKCRKTVREVVPSSVGRLIIFLSSFTLPKATFSILKFLYAYT